MLFYAGADVAIINSGLIVQPFEKDFSRKNLHESLPHQMRLAKLTVSSQELLEIYHAVRMKTFSSSFCARTSILKRFLFKSMICLASFSK